MFGQAYYQTIYIDKQKKSIHWLYSYPEGVDLEDAISGCVFCCVSLYCFGFGL